MNNNLYNGINERLFYTLGKRPETASSHDIYMALCYAVRDQMMQYHLTPEICNNRKEVAYLSADPSTPPYVKVGQHVKQGDTLLLIEAMKTFNEIKAPKSGVIKKIVVLNSQPVEYGDDLVIFE